jgi:ABC-type branched-subunit amino acid transport system permease subunit
MLATLLGGSAGLINFSHVAFAAIGAGLAWWAKQPATPTLASVLAGLGLPAPHVAAVASATQTPDILSALVLLVQRFADAQTVAAHNTLATLAAPVAVPSAPVTLAPAVAK